MDMDIECCEEEALLRNKKRMVSTNMESYMEKLELEMIQDFKCLSTNDASDEKIEKNTFIPYEDFEILVGRIESIAAKEDSFSSWTRVKFIDWNEVAFNEYSAEQCRVAWVSIMRKQRHYRTISELIVNLKEQMMESNSGCSKLAQKNKSRRKLNRHILKIQKNKLESCRKSLFFPKHELKIDKKSIHISNKSNSNTSLTGTQGFKKYLQDLRNRYHLNGIDVLDEL